MTNDLQSQIENAWERREALAPGAEERHAVAEAVKLLDSGERCSMSVGVGDEVLFGKYGGTEIEVDGEEVKILRESDILAKIVK